MYHNSTERQKFLLTAVSSFVLHKNPGEHSNYYPPLGTRPGKHFFVVPELVGGSLLSSPGILGLESLHALWPCIFVLFFTASEKA